MKPLMHPTGAEGEPPRPKLTCPECGGPKPGRYELVCAVCEARIAVAPTEGA